MKTIFLLLTLSAITIPHPVFTQSERSKDFPKMLILACAKKYEAALNGHYVVEDIQGSSYYDDTAFSQHDTYFSFAGKRKRYFDYARSEVWLRNDSIFFTKIANLDSVIYLRSDSTKNSKEFIDRNRRRSIFFTEYGLPFMSPKLIFGYFVIHKKRIIEETERSWMIEIQTRQGDSSQMVIEISKSDTLVLSMKSYFIDKDGWFYNESRILYQEFNQPAFSDPSLYQLPASGQAVYPDPADIPGISETTPNVQPGDPLSLPPFPTIQGDTLSLSDFKGKVVLLDFWYIGCGPCVDALPALQQLQDKYKDQGLVVVGLETFQPDPAKISRFLQPRDVDYLQCYGSGVKEWSRQMQIQAFPTHFLLDREGRVVEVGSGYSPSLMRQSERRIVKLLETQP